MKFMTPRPFHLRFLSDVREKRPALSSGFRVACRMHRQMCVYMYMYVIGNRYIGILVFW